MENEVVKEEPSVVAVPRVQLEKKPFRLHKWHVVTFVLVVVVCLQAFLYLSLMSRYGSLDSKYRSLVPENAALENDYSSLQLDYASLQSNYTGLQSSWNSMKFSYDSMQATYGSLQSSYDSLQSSYSSLQVSYNSLESSYSSLQTDYGVLQSSFDSYYADYANLRSLINQRVLHVDVMDFVTPNDTAVSSIVFSVTGGWSDPSDWNEYWSDLKKMYDWVVNNIEYRSDGLFPIVPSTPSGTVQYREEMWQFPNETLGLRQGDCEDMAILLASMIRSYNDEKYWVECIWISGSLSAHMGVQLPVSGGELTILDPAGRYYTRNWDGSVGSEDISAEINDWLSYWRSSLGSDVRVHRVFSSYLEKYFSSTSEYTSWMYSR